METLLTLEDWERAAASQIDPTYWGYYRSGAESESTPVLWGLAIDGAAGVSAVLGQLRSELRRAMALADAPTLSALDRDLVRPAR